MHTLSSLNIMYGNIGLDPSWYVQHVVVWDPQTDHMFFFLLDDWLSVENPRNGTVEKEVLASCKLIHVALNQHKTMFVSSSKPSLTDPSQSHTSTTTQTFM